MHVQASRTEKLVVGVMTSLIVAFVIAATNWITWISKVGADSESHLDSYHKLEAEVHVLDDKLDTLQDGVLLNGQWVQSQKEDLDEIKDILRRERN